jgi:class 3 adenylate cyclase
MSQTRRLAAILAADVAGYSRLMSEDEEGTLAALKAIRRELTDSKIKEHRGRIVKTTGDGLLLEFVSMRWLATSIIAPPAPALSSAGDELPPPSRYFRLQNRGAVIQALPAAS